MIFNVKDHIKKDSLRDYVHLMSYLDKLKNLPGEDGVKLMVKAKFHLSNILEGVQPIYKRVNKYDTRTRA